MVARLDQGHLNRIKNGRVKPTLVTALRIAHALGTSVNQLFYLEGIDAGRDEPRPIATAHEVAGQTRPGPERALPLERALAPRDAIAAGRG